MLPACFSSSSMRQQWLASDLLLVVGYFYKSVCVSVWHCKTTITEGVNKRLQLVLMAGGPNMHATLSMRLTRALLFWFLLLLMLLMLQHLASGGELDVEQLQSLISSAWLEEDAKGSYEQQAARDEAAFKVNMVNRVFCVQERSQPGVSCGTLLCLCEHGSCPVLQLIARAPACNVSQFEQFIS